MGLTKDRMEQLQGRKIKDFVHSALTGQDEHFAILVEKKKEDELPEDVFPGIQFKDDIVRFNTFRRKNSSGDVEENNATGENEK